MARMLGQNFLSSITVRVADDTPMDAAQSAITRLMMLRHGVQDFFLSNTAEIRKTIEQTTQTLTLLIGAINLWNRIQVGFRAAHPAGPGHAAG